MSMLKVTVIIVGQVMETYLPQNVLARFAAQVSPPIKRRSPVRQNGVRLSNTEGKVKESRSAASKRVQTVETTNFGSPKLVINSI